MKWLRQWASGGAATLVLVGAVGCAPKKKPVTDLQRKEAAHMASEAQFAMSLRDFARAEGLLAKAVELAPDEGALWVTLGATRMPQGKRDAAKQAYEAALKSYEGAASENKTDAEPWLKQVYVLGLLGRGDEARSRLEKTAKQFPDNRNVRHFVDGKQIDRMLADPKFKEMGL